MTHAWGDFDTDPALQRTKRNITRLNNLIAGLESLQSLHNPSETLQGRIDHLKVQRDAQLNQFQTCECGLLRSDHLDGKCLFASTTYRERA